jgi:hypothetical protein
MEGKYCKVVSIHENGLSFEFESTNLCRNKIIGSYKWDGCMNWEIDEPETGVMLHTCNINELIAFFIELRKHAGLMNFEFMGKKDGK